MDSLPTLLGVTSHRYQVETVRRVLRVLRGLTRVHLVGGDLVEVAPAYDHAEITSIAAATVIFDMITLMSRRS